ncbi:DUF6603 domain-containing protein [Actinomadura sp. GTD37]|uniref:DUF6603 domain-containing protein n=1 Tax=Actinomadura sp. GTD37 TaxID=1778030 RepID=UPI0035C10C1A
MARAVIPDTLTAEAGALGRAIGLFDGPSDDLSLNTAFFASPAEHVARVLADPDQRDAALEALDLLLPHAALEEETRLHPLVEPTGIGGLYLGVTRTGAGAATQILLDLRAVAQPGPAAPRVTATVPLVAVRGGALAVVTGEAAHPVELAAAVRLPGDGARLTASLSMAGTGPGGAAARFRVRFRPGPASTLPPLDLDPIAVPAGLAQLAAALVDALLSAADQPAQVRALAGHLTGLLGLSDGLPALPLADLVHDPAAMRGWLAGLAGSTLADGRSALVAWLRHIAGLLGDLPMSAPAAGAPTEEQPAVLRLTAPGPGPAVSARVWLRPAPDSGTPVLVVALSAEFAVAAADAVVSGEGVLLALPLHGTGSAVLAERAEVTVRRAAASGPLVPAGPATHGFGVGSLRAGLRYDASGLGPVLELRDVVTPDHVFPRLDLTDASSLGSAAAAALEDALEDGLGAAGPFAGAVRTLLGLATTPGTDIGGLATAPTRALAAYYRELRQTADGWRRLLAAIGGLLGSGRPGDLAPVTGAGSAADPWVLPLGWWPGGTAATGGFALALWDEGTAGAPRPHLGLRLRVASAAQAATAWAVSAQAALLAADLAPEGGGVRWLGGVRADLAVTPPGEELDGDLGLATGDLRAFAAWTPGTPLTAQATLEDVRLTVAGEQLDLGTLRLPAGADASSGTFGLAVSPAQAMDVLRAVVARAAASWGGPGAGLLPSILGMGRSARLPEGAPAIEPPDPGDAGSLLERPLEALRSWAAALVSAQAGVTAAGLPYLSEARWPLQAFLTDRVGLFEDVGAAGPAPAGHGTAADPWTVPLQPHDRPAAELLTWTLPGGPPPEWAEAVTARLESEALDKSDMDYVTDLAADLGAFVGEGTAALASGAEADASLRLLRELFSVGDGVVPADAAGQAWPVRAAHHMLPRSRDAIGGVLGTVRSLTAGLGTVPWSIVLVAPSFAGDDCWSDLVAAATGPGGPLPASAAVATVDLRGVPDPLHADLSTIGAAPVYIVRLGEKDEHDAVHQAAQLRRVLDRIAVARPGGRTVLVAHSVAGVAARRLVADLAAQPATPVLGLVTLGTPVRPVDVTALTGPDVRNAARLVRGAVPYGLGAPAADDMLAFLAPTQEDLNPYGRELPAATVAVEGPGLLPAARFAAVPATPPDVGATHLLAITGGLPGDTLATILAGEVALAASATGGEVTHLAHGVRIGLPKPTGPAGAVSVETDVRLDLGRVQVVVGAQEPPAPRAGLVARVRLARAGGPLLDTETGAVPETGARIGTLEATVTVPGDSGAPVLDVVLRDAALGGRWSHAAGLDDPRTAPLLARLIDALGREDPAGGELAAFLNLLADLGLTGAGGTGKVLIADAFAALAADPGAYLGPRLVPLLDRGAGLYGLVRDAGAAAGAGPWRWRSPDLPVELVVTPDPWRVAVRTTGAGLATAAGGRFRGDGEVELGGAATADCALSLAGLGLDRGPTGAPRLRAPWLDEPLPLDAGPAELRAALASLVPRLIADVCLTGLLERVIGGFGPAAALSRLLHDPAGWLLDNLLGGGASGTPDPAALNGVLADLADAAGLARDAARPLMLPGGLTVRADAAPAGGTRVSLATGSPVAIGGTTLALSAAVTVAGRHAAVDGALEVDLPLPGSWGSVRVTAGHGPDGPVLAFTLSGAETTVHLLPAVEGVAELVAAQAARLLPEVLDGLTAAAASPAPSPLLSDALAVAAALGVYDPAAGPGHGFAARGDRLARLVRAAPGSPDGVTAAGVSATATLLGRLLGDVVSSPAPGALRLSTPVLGGNLVLDAVAVPGSAQPALLLGLTGLNLQTPAGGQVGAGVTADVTVGRSGTACTAAARLATRLDTGAGIVLTPRLDLSAGSDGGLRVTLRPLGDDRVVVALAPVPAAITAADAARLAQAWVVPLAARLMMRAADTWLSRPLWDGPTGKNTRDLLRAAKVVDDQDRLLPLPGPAAALRDLLGVLDGVAVPLPGGLGLGLARSGALLGLRLTGRTEITAGEYRVELHAGLPAGTGIAWPAAENGVTLMLLDTAGTAPGLAPALRFGGVGATVRRRDGAAVIDAGGVRLGHASGFVRAEVGLPVGGTPRRSTTAGSLGAAAVLGGLGLPLLTAPGPANDPVSGGILAPGTGDGTPANPPIDVVVASGPTGPQVVLNGTDAAEPRWLPVQKSFGPLHLDQLGLAHRKLTGPEHAGHPDAVALFFDGSLALAGMSIKPDGLRLLVPLDDLAEPGEWEIGLDGLAVSLDLPSVRVAGGLTRTVADGVAEYTGELSVDVAGRGFTAIGGYSRAADGVTSLFVFVALPFALGGPPYLFVEGLAGGVGYNRALVVPTDPIAAASFPLVQAVQEGGVGQPRDPDSQLAALRKVAPARRGSHWVAAGVRFSSFELVHTSAVAYAALDRGFQVGLLGVSRMVLPMAGPAIANVELAINARFDSTESLLSIRAQLTDNSWLLSRDCQLTGGFAFVIWFRERRFVLTIGGYSPWFDPEGFPVVPRVGIRWAVSKQVSVKGEAYFAVVPGFMMFGGRIEAAYNTDIVRLWFTAWLDVLLGWDPFYYRVDMGVEVGATFRLRVCFIACVTIRVSVSLGVSLQIEGPPLHGRARVDVAVASVTVHIGDPAPPPPAYLTWLAFSRRYLAGPTGPAVVAVSAGAAADTGPAATGANPPDGSQAAPWPIQAAARLRTESRIPATRAKAGETAVPLTGVTVGGPAPLHPTPCGNKVLPYFRVTHQVAVTGSDGAAPNSMVVTPRQGGFQAALWQPAPAPGDQPQDVDGLPALGGVDLDFITTATGAPVTVRPEITAVSTPLPFGAPAGGGRAAAALAAEPAPPRTRRAPDAPGPRLIGVVHRGGRRVTRPAPAPSAALAATGDAVTLAPGAGYLWRVSAGERAGLAVEGGRARMVCVSGSGHVLADRVVDAAAEAFTPPEGTSHVMVGDVAGLPAGAPGWHVGTPVVQVLPGVALAGRATLLPDGPVPMPAAPDQVVLLSAGDLLRNRGGCRTLLPPATTVVQVLVERADGAAGDAADLAGAVAVDGRTVRGEALRTASGMGLLVQVPPRDDGADLPVRVDLELPGGWSAVAVHAVAQREDEDEAAEAAEAADEGAGRALAAAGTRPAVVRWAADNDGGRK